MTFKVLCNLIKTLSEIQVFQVASSELEKIIFGIKYKKRTVNRFSQRNWHHTRGYLSRF